jgi:hypothetical protein
VDFSYRPIQAIKNHFEGHRRVTAASNNDASPLPANITAGE